MTHPSKHLMTQERFLTMLKNTNPICLANHRTHISLEQAETLNGSIELHFIPNSGGTKIIDIHTYNAYFIDLDCGKDGYGNYYNLSFVSEYKEKMERKLKKFQPSPSAIVETRNGLQVYWFISNQPTEYQWRKVEDYLIKTFNADPHVKNPSNQMRLPCSLWVKDKNNPFYCQILKLEPLYYSYFDFSNHFPAEQNIDIPKPKKKLSIDSNTDNIKKTKIGEKLYFDNYQDIFNYIVKEVDLFDYLRDFYDLRANNRDNFNCIFHEDKHPSASVFQADGGTWLYSCRSSYCEFKIGNIIQVVQELSKLSRHDAIEKICFDLNIEYKENEEFKALLMDNIRTLNDDIKYSHKDLYSVSYRYINTLLQLHYEALNTLKYADSKGFLFSVSTGHLAKCLGRSDRKTTTEDISLFALLELLTKVDINDPNVPPDYKKMIRKFQGDRDHYINVYALPIYDLKQLRHSDDIAKIIKEKNLRKSNFTYDAVYNAFGREVANKVFPQVKGKKIHEPDEFMISKIEYLLDRDGYFSAKSLKQLYFSNNWKFNEVIYTHQLPLITERLNLERICANKLLKEKYNISGKGYPYIYIKKGD